MTMRRAYAAEIVAFISRYNPRNCTNTQPVLVELNLLPAGVLNGATFYS